jgi:hypothetical protein
MAFVNDPHSDSDLATRLTIDMDFAQTSSFPSKGLTTIPSQYLEHPRIPISLLYIYLRVKAKISSIRTNVNGALQTRSEMFSERVCFVNAFS